MRDLNDRYPGEDDILYLLRFCTKWENPGDDADQLIGSMNLKLIRPVLVRHLEAICIIDMKFSDCLHCSKEKYIKDPRIDV